MNDLEMRKRFRKSLAIYGSLGLLVLAIGFSSLSILNHSLDDFLQQQMEQEAAEYCSHIETQISRDYEALRGLAVFLDNYSPQEVGAFSRRLYEAKETNSFVSMAYFGLDGIGVLVNTEQGIQTPVNYRTLGVDVQRVVEKAFAGQADVSPLFDSTISKHQVFAYSVPVFSAEDSRVIGALAATNHVEVFHNLLNSDKNLNGKDAVHLINSNGDLLFSSTDPENTMGIQSLLYGSGLFDEKAQTRMRAALSAGQSVTATMHYNDIDYPVYLCPTEINDWYVMCINNPVGISYIVHRMVRALTYTFVALFLVSLLLLIHSMRANIENTKTLNRIAYHDPLTGADNMAQFMKNLSHARKTQRRFALVALNIHQFKFINEVIGVKVADEILCGICDCLTLALQEGEFFCRESGDSFYMVLHETDSALLRAKLQQLLHEISENAVGPRTDYRVQMYAGVLLWQGEGEEDFSNEMMLTRVRFAMQHARKLRGEAIHFYDAAIHKKEEMENFVETHMHKALETGEFRLFLQPKIDLKTGKLSSAEALVRWITEDGRTIYPDVFIPQFEENGFCVQLDLYMFEQACKQIRAWMDAGVTPISISVNQSKLLFFEKDYVTNLKTILTRYDIPAGMITLEILESLVLGRAEELNKKLRELRQFGFKISMDDFGSGYSSFNTLGNLEIDELKLDRAFLMEVTQENGSRFKIIMEHVIELSKSLHISTVAEGVETEENQQLIQSLGCDYGQGYLYSRPVSSEEFSGRYMQA